MHFSGYRGPERVSYTFLLLDPYRLPVPNLDRMNLYDPPP